MTKQNKQTHTSLIHSIQCLDRRSVLKRYVIIIQLTLILMLSSISQLAYSDSLSQAEQEQLISELISPEEAFKPIVTYDSTSANKRISVDWTIAQGYYLYKDKISVAINDQIIDTDHLNLSKGIIKDDLLFGMVETYFDEVIVNIDINDHILPLFQPSDNTLTISYQGCHEPLGICFPPIENRLNIDDNFISSDTSAVLFEPQLEPALNDSNTDLINQNNGSLLSGSSTGLVNRPASNALQNAAELTSDGMPIFTIASYSVDAKTVILNINIPKDYYLYKDQFNALSLTPNIWINDIRYSEGRMFDDPEFGLTEVFFEQASLTLSLSRYDTNLQLPLEIHFQGCKVGSICLPPDMQKKTIELHAISESDVDQIGHVNNSVSDNLQNANPNSSLWWLLISAFGAGLLLTFTPCVLPMIPILAGILQRQQHQTSDSSESENQNSIIVRSHGVIASVYVLGTAVTYAFIGAVAGASGQQLQAYFQSPAVIIVFSSVLVLMALSMFNVFKLELPASLKSKLNNINFGKRFDNILSYAFFMGLVSALIVGACVSPVLISVIGLVIKQGSLWLGALTLFVMALGMGVVLIAFAFGAKSILPKSGQWMIHVNQLMGFVLIAVAIYLLSAIKDFPVLWPWSIYLYILGFFVFAIAKSIQSIIIRSLANGFALFMLVWAILSTIGAVIGNHDLLRPITKNNISSIISTSSNNTVNTNTLDQKDIFQLVTSEQQLNALINETTKPFVLIDYYADWCKDCIRMEKTTYLDQAVLQTLSDHFLVIKIDVTDSFTDESKKLKQRFQVYGPPASIFLDQYGAMMTEFNFYGYRESDTFLATLNKVLAH